MRLTSEMARTLFLRAARSRQRSLILCLVRSCRSRLLHSPLLASYLARSWPSGTAMQLLSSGSAIDRLGSSLARLTVARAAGRGGLWGSCSAGDSITSAIRFSRLRLRASGPRFWYGFPRWQRMLSSRLFRTRSVNSSHERSNQGDAADREQACRLRWRCLPS